MRQVLCRVLVVLGLCTSACAGVPRPKAPDETGRTPVNKVVPPEVQERRNGAGAP